MTAARLCPECHRPLSSDAPQGLCPECLFKAALSSESAQEPPATGVFGPSPATASPSNAGPRVKYFGDYELLEEIARGGMGIVWKARQSNLNREVALKMIRAGALASPDEVARFLREAEAAANLQHPNIVAIHEVGEHDGQHYFSMDLVDGRDLGKLVTEEGPMLPRRAAQYVKTIAEAIHFAHQHGTLHRDLKPQNVLIDAADQPRITDFGLAKSMKGDSRLTQSGVVMGSPSYMPPEQAAGRHGDIGPASDVYSLGAMLYELLTGQPPFRGATPMTTLRDVMEAEPVAPRRLKADIPPDLETICVKCLEKSPSARYPTARTLAEELDRFLKGEPIQARPADAVRKVVSWARRRPGVLAALAALVMVTLAFGVLYLFEENAFLRAQQSDPTLARIPGWRHEYLPGWFGITFLVCWGCILASNAVRARGCGLSFKQWLTTSWPTAAWRNDPLRPLDRPTLTSVIGVGLILVGGGVVLLVKTIQAHVWEGESIDLWQIVGIYILIDWGLAALGMVIRDYRLVHYGPPPAPESRKLNAEQIESIRSTLEHDDDLDYWAAVKRYRKVVPGAGIGEAILYVGSLLDSLRAENPEKFCPKPLPVAAPNWKFMGIFILVEVTCLAVLCLARLPFHPVWAIMLFVQSLICGAVFIVGHHVAGCWWKKLLVATLGSVSMVLNLLITVYLLIPVYMSGPGPDQYGLNKLMTAFVGGGLCGYLLSFVSRIPRRKQVAETGESKPGRS